MKKNLGCRMSQSSRNERRARNSCPCATPPLSTLPPTIICGHPRPLSSHFWSLRQIRSNASFRIACVPVFAAYLAIFAATEHAAAQPPLTSPSAADALARARITLSVEEQTLGTLLDQILRSVSAGETPPDENQAAPIRSIWMDRRVDPTTKVSMTVAAQPATQVILDLTQREGLALFPLPGVLVVGRDEWVDTTVARLAGGSPRSTGKNRDVETISVRWPTGCTAAELLALIVLAPKSNTRTSKITDLVSWQETAAKTRSGTSHVNWLPHDIWPAGSLIGVERTTAVSLVLAQFDLALKRGTRLETLVSKTTDDAAGQPNKQMPDLPTGVQPWTELPAARAFPLNYRAGDSTPAIRQSLADQKPRSSVRATGEQLTVLATAANHRHALVAHWNAIADNANPNAGNPGNPPAKAAVFDLKLINKAAGDVLRQLAAADGKKIRIEEAAELASEKRINLDGTKKTLRQLAQIVAESAGLAVQWGDDEVVVSKP